MGNGEQKVWLVAVDEADEKLIHDFDSLLGHYGCWDDSDELLKSIIDGPPLKDGNFILLDAPEGFEVGVHSVIGCPTCCSKYQYFKEYPEDYKCELPEEWIPPALLEDKAPKKKSLKEKMAERQKAKASKITVSEPHLHPQLPPKKTCSHHNQVCIEVVVPEGERPDMNMFWTDGRGMSYEGFMPPIVHPAFQDWLSQQKAKAKKSLTHQHSWPFCNLTETNAELDVTFDQHSWKLTGRWVCRGCGEEVPRTDSRCSKNPLFDMESVWRSHHEAIQEALNAPSKAFELFHTKVK